MANILSPIAVADAFVASLSSRRLDIRSALGSYALARAMPDHQLEPRSDTFATVCAICGWARMPSGHEKLAADDAAHLTTERNKWAGVRHLDPIYALFDLGEFHSTARPDPTTEDWKCLELILRTPSLLAPEAKAADLANAIKDILRSNKYERMTLVQILGYAGVLEAPGHPSFFDTFVPPSERDLPPQRFADWGYPIIWWRARDGSRPDAVEFWFDRNRHDHAS